MALFDGKAGQVFRAAKWLIDKTVYRAVKTLSKLIDHAIQWTRHS